MKNNTRAISAAAAEMPPKPKTAAMIEMTRKSRANLSMGRRSVIHVRCTLVRCLRVPDHTLAKRRSISRQRLRRGRELALDQAGKAAAARHQLGEAAALDDMPLVEHQDDIGVTHGGQPVRNHERG